MSLKISPEETTRIGSRGVPNPISTSGQTQRNSTWGARRATNLSRTISPLYRQGSKPMHLLITIFGFGKRVKEILPLNSQFLSAYPRTQIDESDIKRTSTTAPAGPGDQKLQFGERPIPCRPVQLQIVAMLCQANAFPRPVEEGGPFGSLRHARNRAYPLPIID